MSTFFRTRQIPKINSLIVITSFIVLFLGCSGAGQVSTCTFTLADSGDAFDYPDLKTAIDTDILAYPLRNILTRRDSFIQVTYGSSFLKKFDEQNLSLRYLGKETFRFFYAPFGQAPLNIVFDEKEFVVKLGIKGVLDPVYNETKLDPIERIKFRFLEGNFFSNIENFRPQRKKYFDSMLLKYPELSSIKYYKSLLDKAVDNDSLKFVFSTKRIKLSKKYYCILIDSLKEAGFDKLPRRLDYPEAVMDGGGYAFEANTKKKYKMFICGGLPIDSLKMTKFCRYLVKFADLDSKIKL